MLPETEHLRITAHVYHLPGQPADFGLAMLADGLLMLTAEPALALAMRIAIDLAQTTLEARARQNLLQEQADALRTQLDAVEDYLAHEAQRRNVA